MFKCTRTMLAVAAGFAVALLATTPNKALANPKLHEASFYFNHDNTPEVRVGAEDGKWVVMKSSGITYNFRYRVKANRGLNYIWVQSSAGAGGWTRSLCMAGACGRAQRTAWGEGSFFVHNSELGEHRAAVLKACNDLIPQGATTFERHETYARLFLTAEVGVWRSAGRKYKFARLHGETRVRVICEPEGTHIQTPPEPFSVDVQVEPHGKTCPKQTNVTAIIKYKVPSTARFRFQVGGKLSKLQEIKARKVEPPKPLHPAGPGSYYLVKRMQTYHLDPGQTHIRVVMEGVPKTSAVKTVKIDCPPFQATSVWLTLDAEKKSTCPKKVDATVRINGNRPGSVLTRIKNQAGVVMAIESIKVEREGDNYIGRLKKTFNMTAIDTMLIAEGANDSTLNSGWQPLKVECLDSLSGKLTLKSLGSTSCKGEALVAIHTNDTGEMPYELECGPGKSWHRKVEAVANKIGVDKVRFEVTNNEQVTCILRTRIGGVLKPLDGASMMFQCHKPSDAGTSTDLAPELPPGDPPVVGPTLTGDFSFVDNGGTKCPRQGMALINLKTSKPDNVHWSLDCTNGHFSGVAQTAPSPKGGYLGPSLVRFDVSQTTHAKCVLKTVAPGQAKVHTLKGHVFQCVNRTDVGGPDDLAPETPSAPQKPDRPDKIVDPAEPERPGASAVDPAKPDEPATTCANGAVKKGACTCEPHFKPVKAGPNAWRCVRSVVDPKPVKPTVSQPKISCANGTVKNGACTCEPNFKPVKAGPKAWRCIRSVVDPKPVKPTVSQPKISCANGTVKNGACTCARKHKPAKAGKNTWRCVTAVVDPARNNDKADKLRVKTAPKKKAKAKSGTGKTTGPNAKGKAAKKPAILLAP